ncbi:MAG TPA: hypothetical protein VGD60_18470 [Candidatus Acidoferrales bacterium]
MIPLLLSLGLGLALVFLLYTLVRRSHVPVEGSAYQLVEARGSLHALQRELLPRDFIDRLFDRHDLEYVHNELPADIQRLFLEERKRISLLWVQRIRSEILNLMHFHRGHSRFHSKISVLTEIRLAADFTVLLVICRMLEAIFYFRGPYAAPRLVYSVAATAARLCTVSEQSLAFLNTPGLRTVNGGSRRGSATI